MTPTLSLSPTVKWPLLHEYNTFKNFYRSSDFLSIQMSVLLSFLCLSNTHSWPFPPCVDHRKRGGGAVVDHSLKRILHTCWLQSQLHASVSNQCVKSWINAACNSTTWEPQYSFSTIQIPTGHNHCSIMLLFTIPGCDWCTILTIIQLQKKEIHWNP